MCLCMRARPCASVSCTHVRALIHVFDHCGCICAPVSGYPHICGMDVSILACMSLCVFLFSRHIHETKLELFSVWLVCHVFSEFDSCKNFKTQQERERERERERKIEKDRDRDREIDGERERERERGRERKRERGGRERGREREGRMRRVGERGAERKEENGAKEFKNLPFGSSGVHTKCMTSKSEG